MKCLTCRSVVKLTGYDADKQEISRPSELLNNVKVRESKKIGIERMRRRATKGKEEKNGLDHPIYEY